MLCKSLRNIRGILISNTSFPKYLEEEISIKNKNCNLILPYLIKSIRQLESAKSDFLVLPCNTLHSLLPKLKQKSNLKFIDLIDETVKHIKKDYKKIGILSTNKTKKEKLYDKLLDRINIIYPNDEEQNKISEIIVKIIRGEKNKEDKIYLEGLINKFINLGAEKVILACTDLNNLIKNNKHTLDTTQILIEAIIKEMKKI